VLADAKQPLRPQEVIHEAERVHGRPIAPSSIRNCLRGAADRADRSPRTTKAPHARGLSVVPLRGFELRQPPVSTGDPQQTRRLLPDWAWLTPADTGSDWRATGAQSAAKRLPNESDSLRRYDEERACADVGTSMFMPTRSLCRDWRESLRTLGCWGR
jgi:hypothetical protein